MKRLLLLLICLFGLESVDNSAASASAKVRKVELEKFIDLVPGEYRSDGLSISVRKVRNRESVARFLVDVRSPGRRLIRLVVDHGLVATAPTFGIGKFERGGSQIVFVQSFSGGAHCCVTFYFVTPTRSGFKLAVSKGWDGDPYDQWPKDVDGDGRVDIVRNDNQFLYAFTSYADSYSPPLILNLLGNRVEDVSTKPSYRRLFVDDMRDARAACRKTGGHGACAAYVADAARIGEFKTAWADMLRSYNRREAGYPGDYSPRFKSYPEALLHFLRSAGYLPSTGR